MRVKVRAQDGELVAPARRRFEFALGRFSDLVRSVMVELTLEARGAFETRCLVVISLKGHSSGLTFEETGADAATAINSAADRAARTVGRAVAASRG